MGWKKTVANITFFFLPGLLQCQDSDVTVNPAKQL